MVVGIGIIPARRQLLERDAIGRIAVHLVGRHVHERRLRARPAHRFQKIERADGVGVKIIKRNVRGPIVRRLRRRVNDGRRTELVHQVQAPLPIANVQLVVMEPRQRLLQPLLIPAGIALRTEEDGALVVVDAMNLVSQVMEISTDLRPDQAG